MVTQDDITDAMLHMGSYDSESFVEAGFVPLSTGSSLRRPGVAIVLRAFDSGLRRKIGRRKFRKHCTKQLRQEVGFSIDLWFLIGRMMIEIIPILWKWWQERKGLTCA